MIVCLGDVMIDVLARLHEPLAVGSDTPAAVAVQGGGSAANTAAWIVAAGGSAMFFGRVGDDAFGRAACDELTRAGVELAVGVDPARATGACIVLVDETGERTMIPSAGANGGLGEQPLPPDLLNRGRYLHVSGYAVFDDGARPAALAAIERARSLGRSVSVDAASAAPLRRFGALRFMEQIGAALLFANSDEAEVLSGESDPLRAAVSLARRCGEAIVKAGAAGVAWSDGADAITVSAEPGDLVDSTGAGDAFAAGVLAARCAGLDHRASLAAGTTLAATAIGQLGARPPAQLR
jgi:sugar/nucleoside kinase (ribokinase family)